MSALRVEADEATSKNEELTAKIKQLEQDSLSKEQEITSLTHRNQLLEAEVEKAEAQAAEHKALAEERGRDGHQNESNQRRLQILEDEAEEADKNLRETNEKCVPFLFVPLLTSAFASLSSVVVARADRWLSRLRQTDIKAGHYERKVQALESEVGNWEKKYEEMEHKYKETLKALEDFRREVEGL